MRQDRQQDLLNDYPIGERLTMLRNARLDTFTNSRGKTVSQAIQKSVLRQIQDHDGNGGGCFASQKTLADEVGCHERTIGLAIEALTARSLITTERDKRTGTNRHRIVWGELALLVKRPGMRPDATRHETTSRPGMRPDATRHEATSRDGMRPDATGHETGQNETQTKLLNATTTATEENGWLLLRGRLHDLGMKAATQATEGAQKRGWSLEYVYELIRLATIRQHPREDPFGVGHLCNWMTGKTFPPIDEADAMRKRTDRAEAIRERIANEPRLATANDDVKAGWIGRKLAESDLDDCATDDERRAAAWLDQCDQRKRERTEAEVSP